MRRRDSRVGLYKQYLRILAVHNPTCFVMEKTLKGLLSAETKNRGVFSGILQDLQDPVSAYKSEYKTNKIRFDMSWLQIILVGSKKI